ncbi:hypothetical protein DM860_001730 [Cuscuta australis]|uniref:Uncharacterized protein n=1 Tax=Cuscuta australis TaxID=267555 RepID=A0A328E9P4_9ASTE|nr:hypothetical protein DM860_001730 [Cuscuta australis]
MSYCFKRSRLSTHMRSQPILPGMILLLCKALLEVCGEHDRTFGDVVDSSRTIRQSLCLNSFVTTRKWCPQVPHLYSKLLLETWDFIFSLLTQAGCFERVYEL